MPLEWHYKTYQLLWSINDRLGGGKGTDVPREIPDLVGPLFDLHGYEEDALEEIDG